MELEKVHSISHRCCLASRASRSLKYIYIVPLTRHVLLPPATSILPQMSSSPPSQWSTLPVEIQLMIIQLLDNKTLRSLSEASHHNHILCLPAVYSVRSHSPLLSHPHSRHPTHFQHSLTRCTHVLSKTSRSPYHHSRGSNLSWITCRLTMRLISAHSTSAPPALVSLALPLSHRRPAPRHFAEYSPSPLV